ncbi:MAG TPA: ABC transporter permease [Ilumatobacteraceae bacterium]|nr:ABC transporter permease [Ilumatobacteraceae bacterium]
MSLRTAAAHRNLLYLLALKELRTRYKKSALGWLWSLLNPLSQMIIFTVIFTYIFKQTPQPGNPSGLKNFPLYFLSGLLPWNYFSITTTFAMGNMQSSSSLIKKVAFPHEHLVFSVALSQMVTLLIETCILVIALLIAGQNALIWLPVLLPLYALWAMFASGVALVVAAANVFFHDVQYLWSIVTQVLFYATPVVYFPQIISADALRAVSQYGPTGAFINLFHEVLYDGRMPTLLQWIYVVALATTSFVVGSAVFARLSPRFAEEM